jgi:hypothetical protein
MRNPFITERALSAMQSALASREQQSILRREYKRDNSTWRFEDPLFKGWILGTVKG